MQILTSVQMLRQMDVIPTLCVPTPTDLISADVSWATRETAGTV